VSGPLIAMNTMLADSLDWIADRLEAELSGGVTQLEAVASILKELMELHGDVVFGGDGYSEEWHRVAVEERGLRNLPTTADALPVLREDAVIELFQRTGVLSPAELESRYDVYAEQYILSIAVEAKLSAEMAKTLVYPAAMAYLSDLGTTISSASLVGVEIETLSMKIVAEEANSLVAAAGELETAAAVHEFSTVEEHMRYCADVLRSLMDKVRGHADALELEVADEYWPLPKYREMLFVK
jgi:glutamine synthetase